MQLKSDRRFKQKAIKNDQKTQKMQYLVLETHIPWSSRPLFQFLREILILKEEEDTGGEVWKDRLLQLHIPSDVEQRC